MGSGYATNSGINLTIHATQKINNKTGIFWLAQFDSRYGEYLDVICKRLSFSFVFLFHCCDYFMIYIFFKMASGVFFPMFSETIHGFFLLYYRFPFSYVDYKLQLQRSIRLCLSCLTFFDVGR
jgi:hypothetical protein